MFYYLILFIFILLFHVVLVLLPPFLFKLHFVPFFFCRLHILLLFHIFFVLWFIIALQFPIVTAQFPLFLGSVFPLVPLPLVLVP